MSLIAFLNPQGNFDPLDRYWTEHPDFGGQLVYVKELALALSHIGHRVDVVTRRIVDADWQGFEAEEEAYLDESGVRILRIECGGTGFLQKEHLWPFLLKEWVPNLLARYKREGSLPEAITTHYADGGIAGAAIRESVGIPFTFTGHSLGAQKMDKLGASPENLPQLEERFRFSRRIAAERISMSHAGRIITSTQQERMEQYGHPAYRGAVDSQDDERFAVIPPGVNLRIFHPEINLKDAPIKDHINASLARDIEEHRIKFPVVIASSRLDDKKNLHGLVQAFASSQELQSMANLAIVVRGLEDPLRDYDSLGSGEQVVMDRIVGSIEEFSLWGKVTAFPLDSQAELASAYRHLSELKSIFALTAFYEPFGLAPLEAMSCGLPAVVTQNGGPSESMREGKREFGVLVDPEDPLQIADGLLRLLREPEAWESFQAAGIERVESRYTWDRTSEAYEQVIEELIDRKEDHMPSPIPERYIYAAAEAHLDELAKLYFGETD